LVFVILLFLTACNPSKPLSVAFLGEGITDEKLVYLIESGQIPYNVEWLTLRYNYITDVTPLVALTHLVSLDLSNNRISDVSPLADMTWLRGVLLSNNEITDITPLGSLSNLRSLNLNNNQITDMTAVSYLSELTHLFLVRNNISDITPIANLERLHQVDLAVNRIYDLTPLIVNNARVRWVRLVGNLLLMQEQVDELTDALPQVVIYDDTSFRALNVRR